MREEGHRWMDEMNRSQDEWRSEGMEEKEIQRERSPCGLAACFYFKFVLISGVVSGGRRIHRLCSNCGVCLQIFILRS